MRTIDQLIKDYEPTSSTIDLVCSTKITLLAGITGAGKDTIKKELLKRSEYCDIISHTTRKPRINGDQIELDGIDYYFINQLTAHQMLKNHQFVEAKLVHGDVVYGTSVAEIQKAYDENKTAITDIDVQGVEEYVAMSETIISIFVTPPSYDVWISRLMHRYQTQEEFDVAWPKRRDSAIMEISTALEKKYFLFIINDEINDAVEQVNDIIKTSSGKQIDDSGPRLIAQNILDSISNNKNNLI